MRPRTARICSADSCDAVPCSSCATVRAVLRLPCRTRAIYTPTTQPGMVVSDVQISACALVVAAHQPEALAAMAARSGQRRGKPRPPPTASTSETSNESRGTWRCCGARMTGVTSSEGCREAGIWGSGGKRGCDSARSARHTCCSDIFGCEEIARCAGQTQRLPTCHCCHSIRRGPPLGAAARWNGQRRPRGKRR